MNSININKDINPNDKITFQVTMEFFGYSETREFEFIAPKACPQLNKLNNIYLEKKIVKDLKVAPKSYGFQKYFKGGNIGTEYYRLKIFMNSAKNADELKPGETVSLETTDSKINALNTSGNVSKRWNVIKPDNNNNAARMVHLRVKNSFQPTQASGVVTNSFVTEVVRVIREQRVRVIPPENVFNGLVKEVVIGEPKLGDIEDIIIYAYKQYEGRNSARAVRKLMLNDEEVNEKKPPSRQTVLDYRKKRSYSKDFKIDDKKNLICYISIARYTYNGTGWSGEWLQQNKVGQAIWGKAVPKEQS